MWLQSTQQSSTWGTRLLYLVILLYSTIGIRIKRIPRILMAFQLRFAKSLGCWASQLTSLTWKKALRISLSKASERLFPYPVSHNSLQTSNKCLMPLLKSIMLQLPSKVEEAKGQFANQGISSQMSFYTQEIIRKIRLQLHELH